MEADVGSIDHTEFNRTVQRQNRAGGKIETQNSDISHRLAFELPLTNCILNGKQQSMNRATEL